ncbi:TonB-dependent receptor [Kordiimonas aestuarii]|uniref:TonB-dependent receptor n=1 Tax=Kordiimonas aestuarii TaxID=1005925 RepID=UPI0021D1B7A4|nr:TonB-dependent receptor [Kordiimonas aestuarii]
MSFDTQRTNLRQAVMASASALALLTATAAHGADVTGQVKTRNSATSLEGAVVKIEELNRRASTGSDGTFRFANVPAGEYTVIVSYVGAEPLMRKITVTEEGGKLEFTVAGNEKDIEEIFVLGQRGSLNSSISKQRASDNVANFLSADAAGNFPDQNVTEAVRRIVGLSVENDQGEGRYVIIRGLAPNLSSSSVGGVRLPSPEGGDRKVALDVIPSELLETVEVTKSLTPEMDADAIGGNVDIKTLSGFDKDGLFVKAKAEGSYNRQQDEINPKFGLTVANAFNERFAVAGSFSFYNRKFGTDNIEVDGDWLNEDDEDQEITDLYPEELEFRDYVVERRRIGAALNLDFRPNEDHDLYVRGLYSDFKDTERRSRMELKLSDGEFDLDASDVDSGYVYMNGIEADRDMKDRIETQKILSVVAGGESRFNALTATYSVAYSRAEEAEPDRVDTDFQGEDFNAGIVFSDRMMPGSTFQSQADLEGLRDLSSYELDTIEYTDNVTTDKQLAFKFDLAYDTYWGDNPVQLKWGAKARLRDKMLDATFIVYEDLGDYTLADFSTTIDYPLDYAMGNVGPNTVALRDFFAANRGNFEVNDIDSALGDEAIEYDATEDIYATYVQGRIDVGSLRVVGGLRYEFTDFKTNSNFVFAGEEVVIDPDTGVPVLDEDGDPETDDVLNVSPVSRARTYDYFLPSVNLRWEARENLVTRLAYFRSVVRPNISKVVPTGVIEYEEEVEDGEVERTTEGEIGNPGLVPMWAHNFDASVEWYPNNDAVISVGVFYKDIHNFIVDRTLEEVTINGVYFDEVVRPYNGDKGTIKGVELNYQQALTFLPGPLDGLIVGLNYTYVDSEAEIFDGEETRVIPMPKTSKNIANVVLGYEKGPISVRVAMTYRDEYLDELNAGGFGDRYVLDHTQWDFSAAYSVTDNIKVYGEVSNANDARFRAVYRNEDGDFLMQHEQYDWTANMGVKVKF